MKLNKKIDFSTGSISKKLLIFFIPLFLESIFLQLYQVVDGLVVANTMGKIGLGAIDGAGNFMRLMIFFFIGLSSGASIIIGQYYGEKNFKSLSKVIHTSISLALILSFIIGIIGYFITPSALKLINISDELFVYSKAYVEIFFLSLPFLFIYTIGSGILKSLGDSRTPFIFLIISSLLNIILDLLFVLVFSLQIKGVAYATLLSQGVAAILVLIKLSKEKEGERFQIRKLKISIFHLKKIIWVGIPIGLQMGMFNLSNLIVQSGLNALGTNATAAWSLAGKIDFIIWSILNVSIVAVSVFTAHNYGSGNIKRMKQGALIAGAMIEGVLILFISLIYIFAYDIGQFFIKDDIRIVTMAVKSTRILLPFVPLFVISDVLSAIMKGSGHTIPPLIITIITIGLFRAIWVSIASTYNSFLLVVISYPCSWIITLLFMSLYYIFFFKKKLNLKVL